jgi:hypothetical protein
MTELTEEALVSFDWKAWVSSIGIHMTEAIVMKALCLISRVDYTAYRSPWKLKAAILGYAGKSSEKLSWLLRPDKPTKKAILTSQSA